MFSIGWIEDAVKSLDFVNSPMGRKLVVRMLIVWTGVSRCIEYEYVYRCGSLEVRSVHLCNEWAYCNNSPIRLYLHFVILNLLTLLF
jgi:hypothetical protein